MEGFWEKIEAILPQVTRPGRYVGNEIHAIRKDWEEMEVSFALAFPDVYEIGMSHLGLGILYHILNHFDWIVAERVYSPWIDMEEKMRESDIPLFSLESKIPICRFDVLGITLQYELQFTNVLNLLDLARIPLSSQKRVDGDPLVVGGGPSAFNPEPLADFLDAVVLGDGEEVIVEIAGMMRRAKREKWKRKDTLRALSRLEGVYVPSLHRGEYDQEGRFRRTVPVDEGVVPEVRARILDNLDLNNYPLNPLVPLIEVTHDRFSLEIMRGCTRGCRFCNAGMIYRPVRERSVDDLVKQAQEVIANTGYDEIGLVSLSTSDYRALTELLCCIRNTFKDKGVSISFPSLRPDTLTPEMADLALGLRRTGLTLAVEAGTQRLRDVINKNNREEDLLKAVEIAFLRGWRLVKLYFMIGLPTETHEDLEGLVSLVGKVVQVARQYGKREVHVSVSPFSPKAQTPFQWEPQDSLETLEDKLSFLKQRIKWREVKLTWRDPRVSSIEAVLGRGDRRMGEVIYRVWDEGGRFDAWTDLFDYDLWTEAFDNSSLSIDSYRGEICVRDPLPWDHLSKGISKSYFIQERQRAFSEKVTEDCRSKGCGGCGLMEHPVCRETILAGGKAVKPDSRKKSDSTFGRRTRRVQHPRVKRRVRVGYRKRAEVRFTSHLDTVRIFTRTFRRARIPLAFSQGYHAHPKIATGPPLPLGYTSLTEYMDLEVLDRVPQHFERIVNRHLPEGFEIFESKVVSGKIPSLNGSISLASYRLVLDGSSNFQALDAHIDAFLKKNSCRVTRWKQGKEKEVDVRQYVMEMSLKDGGIDLLMRIGPEGTAKVEEVIQVVVPHYEESPRVVSVERTGLYIEKQRQRTSPLEIE